MQAAAEADGAGGYHAYGTLDAEVAPAATATDDATRTTSRRPRRGADPTDSPGAAEGGQDDEELPCEALLSCSHRLRSRTATVCVIGQGYVGLSVAAGAAEVGMTAYGVDRDQERIAGLHAGRNVVPGVDDALFASAVASGRLHFGNDLSVAPGPTSS